MSLGSTRFPCSRHFASALLLSLALLAPAFAQKLGRSIDPDAPAAPTANPKQDHKDDPAARAEWFLLGRRIKGENSALLLQRAYRQKFKMRQQFQLYLQQQMQRESQGTSSAAPLSASGNLAPLAIGPNWQALGPAPISGMGNIGNASGRISAVTVDQSDTTGNTVLVGGAYGGVWRSTNAAAADPTTVTWTALYDADPNVASLAVGAISQQPGNSNVILVGSGEPTNSLLSYYGMGILRSTDGGANWTTIASADSGVHSFRGMGVAKFAWSTSNTNLVVAALSNGTIGDQLGTPSGAAGVYFSTDAGATWSRASSNTASDVDDVVYSPSAGTFFAFISSSGVYSSSNGSSWTRLAAQPGTTSASFRGQIAVRNDDGELFVSWTDSADSLGGVFRSADGGATWTSLTGSGNGINSCGDSAACGGYQGFYNQYVIAVPNGSATDVYFGAGNVFKCTVAAGQTCNAVSGATNRWLNLTHVYGDSPPCANNYQTIHPDQHTADYLISDPNKVYFGNDGGVYRTLTSQSGGMANGDCSASNSFQDLNTSSLGSLSQFISFSQHPTDDTILLGGTQDNGSPGFSTDQPNPLIFPEWYEAWGGDGGFNAIDQTNPNNWYAANTDVSVYKCLAGTGCLQSAPFCNGGENANPPTCNPVVDNTKVGGDRGAFYVPYLLDPYDQSKIIVGTCRVWRGTANGSSLTAISPRLNGSSLCSGSQGASLKSLLAGGPVVNGVASVIYTAFGGGNIFVSTNAGNSTPTWTDRTSGTGGIFPVSGFAIDPTVASGQTAYVTIMGFTGNPNGAGHVFKTTNAGANWTDVGIGLPDAPADGIVVDPRDNTILYVATDVGVFVSNNSGSTWQEYGTGLPAVPVMGIRIFNSGGTQKLRVATHGRGVWQADLLNANDFTLTIPNPVVSVRPGQTAHFAVTATRTGSFASSVALTCVPDPPATGATCGLSPTSADLAANASVPVTLDVPTNAITTTIADHPFNLHGDGGSLLHDLALTLRVSDFSIGSGTTQQTIEQANTATYTVTVTPQGNFSDPVTLSCANFSSAGLSCSFSNNNFTPGLNPVNVTVTLNALANAALGAGTFDVVATSGSSTPSVSLGYNVILTQDFTFIGGTTTQTVLAGNAGAFTATLTPLNSFSATNLTLGCTGLPTSGACVFTPPAPSISAATPQPLAIQVTNPTSSTPGGYNITATATDAVSTKTHSIPLTLNVQNFTLAATPNSRTVGVGAGATYTVNVTAQNGYAGLITLGCNAPPANVTCSFSPAAVTPGTPSTLSVSTTSSVTAGAKTISVTGTAEGQTRTAANVTLSVSTTVASFTATIAAPTKTVNLGSSTTFSINVKATSATSPGSVSTSCVAPLPAGVTCPTFSPTSFIPNTTGVNVTATVQTSGATPVSDQPITFQVTSATTTQFKRASGTLQVQDFTLDATPLTRILPAPTGSAQYDVVLTGINGFGASAALTCPTPPTGVSCSFAPASLSPTGAGAHSTLTVTTTGAAAFGSNLFTVQAVAGSLTHTKGLEIVNGTNDYQLVNAGAALVAVRPGQTANYSVQLNRFGTFSAAVNESCVYTSTTPTGTACNITPNPADLTTGTCPGSGLCTTASLAIPTNSGTTAVGDYPFNFHGNGGASQHDVPLTLRVNDFSITSATTPQTIQQTATGAYTVTVTGLNNWTASVALSCANFSTTGLSCSFSQNNFVPAAGGTSVTVTVTAAGTAQTGSGTFDVSATDGTTTHTVNRGYTVILVQDFTFGNVTGQQAVLPGQTANYSTTLTPLNSFAANVALSCTGLPANSSCAFSPVSPVAIGSATPQPVTASIVTTNSTPAGDFVVTATGTDPVSGKTHSVNLSVRVQSFTLSPSPTSRTIPVSGGTTFSIAVNAQNGLTLPVTLSCAAPPVGLTCIPPAAVTPGSSGIMTVQASSSITAGAKTLTISGTTGFGVPIVNQNVTVTISSTAPSFTLTTSTPTKVVSQGSSTTFTLSVRSTTTSSPGSVTMSCVPPLPTGVACSFTPATFIPTTTARTVTATVSTTALTPAQSFPLQFQAATSSQFKRVNGTLQVADYTLGVQPPTRTISSATGGTASYTATLTSINGFATSTSLSCTGLPAGWTCGFAPTSVTPSGAGATSTLTLTTTNTPLGPQNFTISATGGGITHTQQVEVINGQDFTLSATTPIIVNQNSSNTTTVNAAAIGTFAGSVALSCSTVRPGFSCGFVPAAINPGTPSTLTISADNTVAGGQYTVTVQGQSTTPSLTHTANVTVNVPDFTVGLTGGTSTVLRTQPLGLSGTATALGGFASSVPFSCSTGDVNVPCVAATPVTPTIGGAAVSVTVTPNASAATDPYTVTLTGNDGAGHVHSATFGITVQDFSVGATDAGFAVETGTTTGSYSGSVTGLGFTGNVALTCSSPTISVSCAFSPSSTVAASGAGTAFTFTITPTGAVGGPYVVNVTGTAGGVAHSATVHVSITASQDWSYTYQLATPQSQSVNAGQAASYNIDLTPNNGFNSSVALTCSVTGAPAGVGCGIVGSPLTPPGTITLNVTTTNNTVAPGTYAIVVSGTGGAKTRTTTASLTVRDFSLNVTPASQAVAPGDTADYTVSTATTSAFPDNATLTCAVLTAPTGTSCNFDAGTLAPGGSTTMHVNSTGATPNGSYTVQVTATSGATVHTFNVTYAVNAASPNDFTITTSTPTRTVNRGSLTSYSVTVTATGTFAESVTLTCTGQPAGVSCGGGAAFVPSTAGTNKTITVFVGSATVPGTYNLQIKGTSATKNHSVGVQLNVN